MNDFRFPSNVLFDEARLKLEDNDCSPNNFPNKKTYILTDRLEVGDLVKELGPLISNLDGISDKEISNSVFYIYFDHDMDALPFLKRIKNNKGIFIPPILTGKIEYIYANRYALEALNITYSKSHLITHFSLVIHSNICEALDITKNLEGDYVEIGVMLGGSAMTALNYIDILREHGLINKRRGFLFDTFNGFDYPEAQTSSDQIWKNTHKLYGVEETIKHVSKTLDYVKTDIVLCENNICVDPLSDDIKSIVVANIDVDMYEPTIAALNKVTDLVVPGGIIICEDAASTPGLYGAYLAMEEFLESEKGKDYIKVFKGSQYFLIKNKGIK
jgi:hypothetical protein